MLVWRKVINLGDSAVGLSGADGAQCSNWVSLCCLWLHRVPGNGAGAGRNNATDPIMGKWEIYCTKYTLFYAVYPSFSTINPFSFDSMTNFIKYNFEKKHLQKGDWF